MCAEVPALPAPKRATHAGVEELRAGKRERRLTLRLVHELHVEPTVLPVPGHDLAVSRLRHGIPNIFASRRGCRAVMSATSSSQVIAMRATYPESLTATTDAGSAPPSAGGSCWSKSGLRPRR